MQIKHIKSIKNTSEYFQSILLTDGKNMFYNNKFSAFINDGSKTMAFQIKDSYDCLFIDEFAYVINEQGTIFCINLETQKCTILDKNFGIDCELYKVFDDKLLVSTTHNEFYRKAYIVDYTDIKELNCTPKYCVDILGLGNQIYFVSTNSFKERNCELSIYNYTMNNNLTLVYKTSKAVTLSKYSIEPNNKYIAYADGKNMMVFDFCGMLKAKVKIPETVFSIKWINEGKYLLLSARLAFYIYDGKSFSFIKKVEFPKESIFLDVKCSYDNNCFCAMTNDETILFTLD